MTATDDLRPAADVIPHPPWCDSLKRNGYDRLAPPEPGEEHRAREYQIDQHNISWHSCVIRTFEVMPKQGYIENHLRTEVVIRNHDIPEEVLMHCTPKQLDAIGEFFRHAAAEARSVRRFERSWREAQAQRASESGE